MLLQHIQWGAETLAPGIAKMQMEDVPLSWRDWNPKISLPVPRAAGTILFNLEIFTGWSLSILQMQLSVWENLHSPPTHVQQATRRASGPKFHLSLLPCASWVEKHSKQTGVLLISCKWSWEGKLVTALRATYEKHTQSWAGLYSKLKSIETPVPAKPDLTPILQHLVLPGSVLAAFTDWSQFALWLWNSFQTSDKSAVCWLTARYVMHRTIMSRKCKNLDLFLNLFLFNTS